MGINKQIPLSLLPPYIENIFADSLFTSLGLATFQIGAYFLLTQLGSPNRKRQIYVTLLSGTVYSQNLTQEIVQQSLN